jgi:hypothetical protein
MWYQTNRAELPSNMVPQWYSTARERGGRLRYLEPPEEQRRRHDRSGRWDAAALHIAGAADSLRPPRQQANPAVPRKSWGEKRGFSTPPRQLRIQQTSRLCLQDRRQRAVAAEEEGK